ncbi:hypothetical protein B9G98_00551 [Wickerhamiella sorbophila]|uniref:VPS9 domain-containing protein n=1 Tax=Wickerhamiella sorbophila TaxID=45607 RepID=A0A2T0FD82_9ASCO|nr:hypothetical protein B9G98_00551 [Wickerhamiella sorbophila]PRT52931.1 hypothetical protein B9G98_00551 [Wickerhamiella sorbophila]
MFFSTVIEALFDENVLVPNRTLKQAHGALNGTEIVALISPDMSLSHQIPKDELYQDSYLLAHMVRLGHAKVGAGRQLLAPTFTPNTYVEIRDSSICFKTTSGQKSLDPGKPVGIIDIFCWNPGVSYIGCDRVIFMFILDGLFVPLRKPRQPLFSRLRGLPEQTHAYLENPSRKEGPELSSVIGKDKTKLKKANACLGELVMSFDEQVPTTAHGVAQLYRELVERSHSSLLELGIDNKRVLCEWLECHTGYRVFKKLRSLFHGSTFQNNRAKLTCLDVSQVGLPDGIDLAKADCLVNRVVETYNTILQSTNINEICCVLIRVIDSLGEADLNVPVSADALLGLFLLVALRAQTAEQLDVHLFILRNFSYFRSSLDRGHLGYTLMIAESVVHHIEHSFDELLAHARAAETFWHAIETNSIAELEKIEDKSIFKARRTGTALFSCINSGNTELANYVLGCDVLTTHDLVNDRDEQHRTLLIAALKAESPLVDRLISIISTLSVSEQKAFYQSRDVTRRSVGHCLFHRADLIKRLGPFIDWNANDFTLMSPLLTVAVCYDHQNYDTMLLDSLNAVTDQDPNASLYGHFDKKCHSLLHLANPQSTELMAKLASMPGYDIAVVDSKLRSALINSLRFNRIKLARFFVQVEPYLDSIFFHVSMAHAPEGRRLLKLVSERAQSHVAIPDLVQIHSHGKICYEFSTPGTDGAVITRTVADFSMLRRILEIKFPLSWLPTLGLIDDRWLNNSTLGTSYSFVATEVFLAYVKCLKSHATIKNSEEFKQFCTDPKWSGQAVLAQVDSEAKLRHEPVDKQQNLGSEKTRFFAQESRSIDTFFQFSIEQIQALMQQLTRLASSMQHLLNCYLEETFCQGYVWNEISDLSLVLFEHVRPVVSCIFRQKLQHVYWKPRIECASLALNSARIIEVLSVPVAMIKEMNSAQEELEAERAHLAELGSRKIWSLSYFEERRINGMQASEDKISRLRMEISRLMNRICHSQEILASELASFMEFQERTLLDMMQVIAVSNISSLKKRLAKTQFILDSLKATPGG